MPFALNGACRLYWRQDGSSGRPALLLLNSLGSDMSLWERTLPLLSERYCVIRMDTRGQGASDAPAEPYTLDVLAADAQAVLDAANVESAFVCGLGFGAPIAMALTLSAPARVRALILAGATATTDRQFWQQQLDAVLSQGMAAVADNSIGVFFSESFASTHPQIVATIRTGLLAHRPEGYAGACAAFRDFALLASLSKITAPTLVIYGKHDVATPFEGHAKQILAAIAGARPLALDAAHLACLETPSGFAGGVISFIEDLLDGGVAREAQRVLFDAGMKTRRRVLGDATLDRAIANRNDFNADYQDMVTRYAWHEVWARPGLDHRTRRLLVLAITASLGRWEEFRLHLRIGLQQGGFTLDEVKETLLQAGVYAGLPVAHTAFNEAGALLRELDAQKEAQKKA